MQLKTNKLYANTYKKKYIYILYTYEYVVWEYKKTRKDYFINSEIITDLIHGDKMWQIKTTQRLKILPKKGFHL